MKRRMASLLALLLLAASLPTTAQAAEGEPTDENIPAVTESPLLSDMAAAPTVTESPIMPDIAAEPTETPEAAPTPEAPATVEPTEPATPTPTEPIVPAGQIVQLQIDDANIYEGMDRAYKDGYVPQVSDGTVTLVVPLVATGPLLGNRITVTPNFGDAASSPIQFRNYQKTFSLADNPVNVTGIEGEVIQTVRSYLVRFDFPLRSDRKDGTYPISLDIQAEDEQGSVVIQSYNCYVNITDGKKESTAAPVYGGGGGGGGVSPTEVPVSNPRILVSKYKVSKDPIMAGDDFTVTVTLKNTSPEGDVQNMLVTVSSESNNLILKNDTSTIFLGDLAAGGTTELELKYGTDRETPAQRYDINLAMDFDDEAAMSMTSSGSVTVAVAQPVDVELAPFTMPSDIGAGETVQLSFQVMNLGRTEIYNARVELAVPGLSPSGNAFIGNMEAGTSATQTLNVFAGMKDGNERYGYTSGIVRLIYEDVDGKEYTQEVNTATNIKELIIAAKDPAQEQEEAEKEQKQATQWWIFVALGALAIVLVSLIIALRRRTAPASRHMKK